MDDATLRQAEALYQSGWNKLKSPILIGARAAVQPLTEAERRSISDAIVLLQECLSLQPAAWGAHWAIGKGWQRLGDHEHALVSFEYAGKLEPGNADIWREASIEAMQLRRREKAIALCRQAILIAGSRPDLQANLRIAESLKAE